MYIYVCNNLIFSIIIVIVLNIDDLLFIELKAKKIKSASNPYNT